MIIVGPGRIGRSLAEALEGSAAGVRTELRGREATGEPAATVVFCVPDDALAGAAQEQAARLGRAAVPGTGTGPGREASAGSEPPVALHTSGVHPASVLAPLRDLGYEVAAWHPLTVVDRADAKALLGVTWGVEGDAAAVDRATSLSRALGGRVLRLAPDQHARYHAAAVFASNFLVACLGAAAEELGAAVAGGPASPDAGDAGGGDAGGGDDDRARLLLPLARAALDAVDRGGLRRGLTGPVVRGDVGTVRRHLEALDPERRELYRVLARELLALAGPELPPARAAALEEALTSDRGGRPRTGGTEAK